MRLNKILFLLFFLLCVGVGRVQAQLRTIEVQVNEKYEKGVRPKRNVEVYGFFDKKAMEALRKKFVDSGKDGGMIYSPVETDFDCMAKTNPEGFCELDLPMNGWVLVRPDMSDPIPSKIPKNMKVVVTLESGGGTKVMGEVKKVAKAQRRNRPACGIRAGNRKWVGPFPFYLFENQTKSNARMVLAPLVVTFKGDTVDNRLKVTFEDTVMFARPFVKDGEQYNRTQMRRMGFDISNDPLAQYRSTTFMQTREEDSVMIYLELYPLEVGKHYRVNAHQWFEDFNTVYSSDSVCLDEGYDKDPMYFLDYDLVNVPIDRQKYERVGRREMRNDHRKLDLKFLTGKAELDPEDTLSFKQLTQLKQDLSRYVRDGGGISSATIHGQASPEGGAATNERLCRERAAYLRGEIGRAPAMAGADLKVTANVAPWSKVVNLLEADSLAEEAVQVRAITNSIGDMRAQEQRISALPCYAYIKERVLPRLRVVDFEFNYFVNRVKSRDEIWTQFQNDPEYRAGRGQLPYEFYQLFQMELKDDEREVLAKAAFESVKDEDGFKPWALAAYELAHCYLKRGHVDTLLLQPYLDWRLAPNVHPMDFEGNSRGYINDEAIVAAQIGMYCLAKDYLMADSLAANLLPESPKYKKLRVFLSCLCGYWNDPEVRDTVEASSAWNKVVVVAAQDTPDDVAEALRLLQDETKIDQMDPRTLYLTTQLRFRAEADKTAKKFTAMNFRKQEDDIPAFTGTGYGMDEAEAKEDWGYPLIMACLQDEKYVNLALYDGYFNEAFRKAFWDYWARIKSDPTTRKFVEESLFPSEPEPEPAPAAGGEDGASEGEEGETSAVAGDQPPVPAVTGGE